MNGSARAAVVGSVTLCLLLLGASASATEGSEGSIASDEVADTTSAEVAEAVTEALVHSGVVPKRAAKRLRQRLTSRLSKRQATNAGGHLCAGSEGEACRERVRAEVTKCIETAQEISAIGTPRDAGDLAEAVLIASDDAQSVETTGQMVRAQLRQGWTAHEALEAATQLDASTTKPRWRTQARKLLRECAAAESCNREHAEAALRVMSRQSKRADADPRRAGRTLQEGLRQQRRQQAKGRLGVQELERRLQTRLRQRRRGGATDAALADDTQRRRHRYRNQVSSETSQGGDYGGGGQGSGQRHRYRGGDGSGSGGHGGGGSGSWGGNGYGGGSGGYGGGEGGSGSGSDSGCGGDGC